MGSKVGGRYELQRLLARGAMGVVYEALDAAAGRDAVVKVLPAGALRAATRARFLREAELTANVEHPNVVRCWDAGFLDNDVPYIVMERLQGMTLEQRLREVDLLSVKMAMGVLRDILCALTAIHEASVFHRDVKPANVFLAERGAVLFDFGLCLDQKDTNRLTARGLAVGTPGYMAPEQVAGSEVDARTDLYCASVTAYETLTGRRPIAYGETSVHKVFEAVQKETPKPPSALQPSISGEIDALILRGLAKDPGDRYASAAEMKAQCDSILQTLA